VKSSALERAIVGEGTPEALWAACSSFDALAPLDVSTCWRAVVLAPHPDDETLGFGGAIATLLGRGTAVVVVFATDGEASHPGSTALTREGLRARRAAESEAALRALAEKGSGEITAVWLHIPDGTLARNEEVVADRLAALLQPGDWCVATWERDGHPDHEAAGRAAREAASSAGASMLSYPVWTWHWADPLDVPWEDARRLVLSASASEAKARAVACYESQTAPLGPEPGDAAIVPPGDLAHFGRPFEVVFT
jgi:LmbE family N-acetylglucosaminyl deacetylase